jgi:hypothetical protein
MLLMQIMNSLVRQWGESRFFDRVLSAGFFGGVVIGVTVSALFGSIIVAVSFGLLVLLRTGLLATRRQRKIREALEPLHWLRSEEQQRESNILRFVAQLDAARPPSGMHDDHQSLASVLEELIEARESHRRGYGMDRYVSAVIALRLETDKWSRLNENSKTDNGDRKSYIRKIRDAIHRYYVADEEIAANRHLIFITVAANLQEITSTERSAVVHRKLIDAIVGMDELATNQRLCLGQADEAGAVKIAAELVASQMSVEKAIKQSVRA